MDSTAETILLPFTELWNTWEMGLELKIMKFIFSHDESGVDVFIKHLEIWI